MGEKDKAERMLENYADVFADIVNVLMFGGKRLISPDELVEVDARSQFKAESGKLHEQERDCAKLWRRNGRTLALLGLENQTDIDEDMPLRVFGYEGAGYKSQLLDKTKGQRYPVSTLICILGRGIGRKIERSAVGYPFLRKSGLLSMNAMYIFARFVI